MDNLVSRFQVIWGHVTVGLAYTTGVENGKINKKQEARAAVIFSDCHHLSLNALPETIDLMGLKLHVKTGLLLILGLGLDK